jgi:hypothetical protein
VIQTIVFLLVLGFPFIVYLINMALAQRDQRGRGGIAAGIPKAQKAKAAKPASRARTARVRSSRIQYCGRAFHHFSLAIVGSAESCRFCTYSESTPTPIRPEEPRDPNVPYTPPPPVDEREAAVREAEDIIERWKP